MSETGEDKEIRALHDAMKPLGIKRIMAAVIGECIIKGEEWWFNKLQALYLNQDD